MSFSGAGARKRPSGSGDGTVGAAGPQGPIGPVGPIGPQGLPGVQGPTGVQGSIGPAGPQGLAGAASIIPGPAGSIGPTGPQGQQGIPGTIGPTGPQGVAGSPGATGPTGPQGQQGTVGSVGPTGPMGPQGGAGAAGATGSAGTTRFLIGPFYAQNPVASATTQMSLAIPTAAATLAMNAMDIKLNFAGRIVGGIVVSNAPRTAGTLTLHSRVGGVAAATTVALDATNTQSDGRSVASASGRAFAAGDSIGAALVTSGWAPTTADLTAWLLVEV